jgi:DNA-binding NtrC family response regulator
MVARIEREQDAASTTLSDRDPFSVPPEAKAGIRVLIVDDERGLREGLTSALRVEGYDVTAVASGSDALALLRRSAFDVVLTDLYLAPVSGHDVLRAAISAKRDAIVIVITGNPSVATSLEVMRLGAWDYLPKPFSATHLQILLGRAAHLVLQGREMRQLRAQLQGSVTLIGTAPAFRQAVTLAARVAPTDASVFFVGESGSGKDVFARFVHQQSRRANRPLVSVNCAAVPEPLLESELFGCSSVSDRDKPGLLESAHHGTLLLDDVTEMSAAIQARLVRVLQEGVVVRRGSTHLDAVVDIRFISSTSRDPGQGGDSGKLRPDLLYRLRVVPIRIPPLRERPQDVGLLATHFLTCLWHRHRPPEAAPPRFTREAIDVLRTRPWPGNVREL